MKGLLLGLLASVAGTHQLPAGSPSLQRVSSPPQLMASDWSLSTQLADACSAQAEGIVTQAESASEGASVDVQCTNESVMGQVSASIVARSWRQRRVTLTAELHVSEAMTASLWLKTQQGNRTLMFDDDSEQLFTDSAMTDGWVRRSVTLPVAADATQVSFGMLLQGTGDASVRELHLTVSEPGAMAPEAAQLLDSAVSIVKQQTAARNDLAWSVLEPQLRLFASGAQSSADAYPAIKYLLSRLGDKQSLLLAPQVANVLRDHSVAASHESAVNIFVLPDGAQLVLSRVPAATELRTAQTMPRVVALP